jgi:DNA-binding transcriptional LysR family regulator
MLNVTRLRVLREVANRRSFSGAADALSYTQSAVSQQIATLEAETQTTLIERRARGLRLTAAGELLVEHTEGILARLDAAEADLAALAGVRGGRLRMASFPTAGATLMPVAIATFRRRFPEVGLTLAEGEPQDTGPRLEAGEFDLALLFEFRRPGRPLGPTVRRVELLEDPMYLALPANHPLAAARALRLADLRDEAWVQTSSQSPCARHVVRSCHAAGFEPNVAFESDDYQTVQGLVGAGVGVALIPELALAHVRDDIAIREISPRSPVRRVTVATPTDALAPAAEAMLAILEEAAARYAGQRRPRVAGLADPGTHRAVVADHGLAGR